MATPAPTTRAAIASALAIVAMGCVLSTPAAAAPPPGGAAAPDTADQPAPPEPSQEAAPFPTLVVQIADAERRGQILLSLCTEDEYFKPGGPTCARSTRLDPAATLTWTITDAPAGTYIVRGIHDLDGDGQLKTKIFGIPAEPTFASNNARGRRGPPSFEDMAFDLTADGLEITLRPIRY